MSIFEKLIQKLKTEKSNRGIGKTGPLESRPTGDIAYRYNLLKDRGTNKQSEEEALLQALEQESVENKTPIQLPPDFLDLNLETRKERLDLLREIKKRTKEKKE